MNKELKKILDHYNLSEKDRSEYLQIFSLLSWEKKKWFLENAEKVISAIFDMRKDLQLEQEILMWKTLTRIEEKIYIAKKKRLITRSHDALLDLKWACT